MIETLYDLPKILKPNFIYCWPKKVLKEEDISSLSSSWKKIYRDKKGDTLKKIAKEFRHFSKYATQISKDDLKDISIMMFTILKKQKQILQLIEKKLDIDIWQEINKRDHIDCQ